MMILTLFMILQTGLGAGIFYCLHKLALQGSAEPDKAQILQTRASLFSILMVAVLILGAISTGFLVCLGFVFHGY